MNLDESQFRQILADLLVESPLACRALLRLARLEFTDRVPSLGVTLADPPVLKVNLGFLRCHACTEEDVKAVLLHEFLHVLLRHTQRLRVMTPLLNLALDAVINATIHRLVGQRYSAFFSEYYRDATGMACLLRPQRNDEQPPAALGELWTAIHLGTVVAEDVYRFLQEYCVDQLCARLPSGCVFIGNHDDADPGFRLAWEELPPDLARVLRQTLDSLPGDVVATAGNLQAVEVDAHSFEHRHRWAALVRQTFAQTRTHDPQGPRNRGHGGEQLLPVLYPGDRRAILRSVWNPIFADSRWPTPSPRESGTVSLYLDVSGSMASHLGPLLSLLLQWQREIRRPLWAFSTCVERAEFHHGRLRTRTTQGTLIECVLEHFGRGTVPRALVITDGHIGSVSNSWRCREPSRRLQALITPGGNPEHLIQLGIPCTVLP